MRALRIFLLCCGLMPPSGQVDAQPIIDVYQGEEVDLAETYATNDLLHGLIALELPGDIGWHPANTDPDDHLPAFTDGLGVRGTGLTGLLADFPGAGNPAKVIRYELPFRADIAELRVFTGNNGRDGRVFHTYTVSFSSDGANTFSNPIYVQTHPSGTINNSTDNSWRVVLSRLTETAGVLAQRATHVELRFYAVDNTTGQMRDPFDGSNPFTGVDDGLSAAFVSPLVWEVDLIGQYELPVVLVTREEDTLRISWVGPTGGATIQGTTNLGTMAWQDLDPQPVISSKGHSNLATIPIADGTMFMRVKY